MVQALVGEETHFKEGIVDASRGEGAEQFAEDQGREGHGAGVDEAVAVHAVGGEGVVVHAQGGRRNGQGLNDQGDGDVLIQNRFLGIPRRFEHGFLFAFFHAEGQCREGVRDQVEPQELDGQEWRGQVHDDGEEDHQYFPDITAQEEGDEFFNIGVDDSSFFHGVDDGGEVVVG